jgi:hypothetical protein
MNDDGLEVKVPQGEKSRERPGLEPPRDTLPRHA